MAEISKLFMKAIEEHNKKSLSQSEKEAVQRQVDQRILELEEEAKLKFQAKTELTAIKEQAK